MRLTLIGAGDGWHTQDIARAACRLGVELEVLDFRRLSASIAAEPASPVPRRVLVRTMPAGSLEQVIFRMDVLLRMEAAGARIVNRPRALETAIDKYLSAVRMEAAGLPIPETHVAQTAGAALAALERIGGEAVLKPIFGSEGRGVLRLAAGPEAGARFREMETAGSVICLQRFVRHPGCDFRVLVLGDVVLCGMRRVAADGWITNIARGGRAEPLEVTPDLAMLALRAARAVGAEVAGVDLLADLDGKLWVLEVNAVPGWRALAPASGVDVAREVVRHVCR